MKSASLQKVDTQPGQLYAHVSLIFSYTFRKKPEPKRVQASIATHTNPRSYSMTHRPSHERDISPLVRSFFAVQQQFNKDEFNYNHVSKEKVLIYL